MRIEIVLVEWKGATHVYCQRVGPAGNRKVAPRRRLWSLDVATRAPQSEAEAVEWVARACLKALEWTEGRPPQAGSGALEGGGGEPPGV